MPYRTHIRLADQRQSVVQTFETVVFEDMYEGVLLSILHFPAACEFEVVRLIADKGQIVILAAVCEKETKLCSAPHAHSSHILIDLGWLDVVFWACQLD